MKERDDRKVYILTYNRAFNIYFANDTQAAKLLKAWPSLSSQEADDSVLVTASPWLHILSLFFYFLWPPTSLCNFFPHFHTHIRLEGNVPAVFILFKFEKVCMYVWSIFTRIKHCLSYLASEEVKRFWSLAGVCLVEPTRPASRDIPLMPTRKMCVAFSWSHFFLLQLIIFHGKKYTDCTSDVRAIVSYDCYNLT